MPNHDQIKKYQDTLIELGGQRRGVSSCLKAFKEDDSSEIFEYYSWWLSAIDYRIKNVTELLLREESR